MDSREKVMAVLDLAEIETEQARLDRRRTEARARLQHRDD